MPGSENPIISLGKLMPDQWESMQKLLESQTFASSPRLREVLTHLVQLLADGTADQVNEQSIGQDVFGKPVGYNASEDNIVRVTIRHLRTRLDDYYRSEGKADPWVLNIPKGKYVPVLLAAKRGVPSPAEPTETTSSSPPPQPASPASEVSSTAWFFRPLSLGLAILLLLAGVAGGYLMRPIRGLPVHASGGVVGQLSNVGDDLLIVVVDSNLQAFRQIFHRQVSLDDYIHRAYAKEPLDSTDLRVTDARQFATGSNETNVSSVIVAAAFREALTGRRMTIKHPHDVSVREFQDQKSVILLGGPFINPWGQLFENRLNFRLLPAPAAPASSVIHNLKPQAGEAADYIPHADGNLFVNYVRIAILPNFQNSGHVVLIGATSAEALEEAGTYLLSTKAVTDLENLYHIPDIQHLEPLEFVLEVRGLNSVPNSYKVIAHRNINW